MTEVLTKRLRNLKKITTVIGLGIGYSKNVGGGFYHVQKQDTGTSDTKAIYEVCLSIFDKYYEDCPIRKVSISLGGLQDDIGIQLNIFEPLEEIKHTKRKDEVVDKITGPLLTLSSTENTSLKKLKKIKTKLINPS